MPHLSPQTLTEAEQQRLRPVVELSFNMNATWMIGRAARGDGIIVIVHASCRLVS